MNDWAHVINSKQSRISEMEHRSAPMFWLIVVFVVYILSSIIYQQYQNNVELERLRHDFATVQNGGIVGVGEDKVMMCTVRKVMGDI